MVRRPTSLGRATVSHGLRARASGLACAAPVSPPPDDLDELINGESDGGESSPFLQNMIAGWHPFGQPALFISGRRAFTFRAKRKRAKRKRAKRLSQRPRIRH